MIFLICCLCLAEVPTRFWEKLRIPTKCSSSTRAKIRRYSPCATWQPWIIARLRKIGKILVGSYPRRNQLQKETPSSIRKSKMPQIPPNWLKILQSCSQLFVRFTDTMLYTVALQIRPPNWNVKGRNSLTSKFLILSGVDF